MDQHGDLQLIEWGFKLSVDRSKRIRQSTPIKVITKLSFTINGIKSGY